MGQDLGVFMKTLMSDKFKTVYKQASLLLVCGHVSYKGSWLSVMFCPCLLQELLRTGSVRKSSVCICCWVWWWGRMMFSPAWPFHTGAVTPELCPAPTAGQSCFASDTSWLVWAKILLVPGSELVLNPLGHGNSGPTLPCDHPRDSHVPACLSVAAAAPKKQPWSCRGAGFPARLESLGISELHLSNRVL